MDEVYHKSGVERGIFTVKTAIFTANLAKLYYNFSARLAKLVLRVATYKLLPQLIRVAKNENAKSKRAN